jgi:hypothetical protein
MVSTTSERRLIVVTRCESTPQLIDKLRASELSDWELAQ